MSLTLKRELKLTDQQARAAFGAARAVVACDGPVRARGAALLETVAATLELEPTGEVAGLRASVAEVAAAFPSPEARHILCDTLIIAACIEGEVSVAAETAVQTFAKELGVSSHWVALLPAIRGRRVFRVKQELFKSSPDGKRVMSRTWSEGGVLGVAGAIAFVVGLHRDAKLAARFRALAALPEGSFGRSFHDHLASRGLNFPGEKGGLPERMIHHDLMHVLNDYSTEPAGECELAGFYAGCCSRLDLGDWFTFMVVVLTTFQLGMPVSPSIVTPARGAFDPSKVLAGFLRGRRLTVDVMGPWDYWALLPLPLGEARTRLGIGDEGASSAERG